MHRRTVISRLSAVAGLVIAATPLVAQTGVTIGPIIGVNFAKVGGADTEEGWGSRVGIVAGGFATFQVSRSFAIHPQLLYASKGIGDTDEEDELVFNYLQVPVLAQLRFPGPSSVTPYIIAGPSVAFEVSCRVKVATGSDDCASADIEVEDTDVSLIVGAGIEVGSLTMALRYDYGIKSLDAGPSPSEVYNRVLTLTVGYGFRLGR